MTEEDKKNESEKSEEGGKGNLVELYEKMSKIVRENLERAGMITEDVFERGMRESRDWAFKMKDYYGEDIGKVSDYIRRDWHEGVRLTREQARKSLDLDRLQAGLLGVLSRLAGSAGSQLETFASKLKERLTYKTGEIAGAGTLECKSCGQTLMVEKPTRIPPCPKCRGTVFERSY
jgi:hypothetical protein